MPHRSQPDAADQTDRQLGASVRARRIERGLSQTALARAVGVSQAAISGVESGRHGHSSDTIRAICREATETATMARRWEDAGRLIERVAPELFAAMVAAAEATALEISAQPRALIS